MVPGINNLKLLSKVGMLIYHPAPEACTTFRGHLAVVRGQVSMAGDGARWPLFTGSVCRQPLSCGQQTVILHAPFSDGRQ